MRIALVIITALLLGTITSTAQVKFGIKGGVSAIDIEPSQLAITNTDALNEFGLSIAEADLGVHFGIFTQFRMGKFFIQPEVLFNSNKVNYQIEDISNNNIATELFSESYQYLDIPVMLGFKFGPLRLNGGPVGHVFINSSSELLDVEGYEQKFNDLTLGYQAGLGLDIGKRLMLDFRYEGNFNNFGDHITFFGQDFQFDDTPGRLIGSIGFKF